MENAIEKQAPILFTQEAVLAIAQILQQEKAQKNNDPFLRVGVKGGGCTGMSYVLEVAEQEADDEIYTIGEDIRILVKPSHQLYLKDMTVEYSEGLNSRGFTFKNPNAKKSCGCGSSFAV